MVSLLLCFPLPTLCSGVDLRCPLSTRGGVEGAEDGAEVGRLETLAERVMSPLAEGVMCPLAEGVMMTPLRRDGAGATELVKVMTQY